MDPKNARLEPFDSKAKRQGRNAKPAHQVLDENNLDRWKFSLESKHSRARRSKKTESKEGNEHSEAEPIG
jgi:hypothetical protein